MKAGTLVCHSKRSEWGTGVVQAVLPDGKVIVFFERCGQKTLQLSAARHTLEVLDLKQVPAGSALRYAGHRAMLGTRSTEASAWSNSPRTVAKCWHCKGPLGRSQYPPDRKWKSCPRCSTDDGEHHLYHEYPASFGQSEARESRKSEDGAQSYCIACRQGTTPDGDARRCPEVLKPE